MIAGVDGPVVVLSAETAFILEQRFKSEMARLRVAARGRNLRVAQELLDLREAAMRFAPSGSVVPELEPVADVIGASSGQWLSPVEVADLLGLSDRGVRKACASGRLEAEQDRGRWQISRQAVEDYRAARSA
jgi:excisionase family DNA binding protein